MEKFYKVDLHLSEEAFRKLRSAVNVAYLTGEGMGTDVQNQFTAKVVNCISKTLEEGVESTSRCVVRSRPPEED